LKRLGVIRCPEKIIKELKVKFPDDKNPKRMEKVMEGYNQFQEIDKKIQGLGTFVYGKYLWENAKKKKTK